MKTTLPTPSVRKSKAVYSFGWLPQRNRIGLRQLASATPQAVHAALRHNPDVVCLGRGLDATPAERAKLVGELTKVGVEFVCQQP